MICYQIMASRRFSFNHRPTSTPHPFGPIHPQEKPKKWRQSKKKLAPGMKINLIRIVEIETNWSNYFEHFYRTGWVRILCLACGNEKRVRRNRLSPRPSKSIFSCGCKRRPLKPPKPGRKPKPRKPGAGRKPADLTNIVFGQLEPLTYQSGVGWICNCSCGRVCIVPKPYKLIKGAVKACPTCRPVDWSGKRGPKPGSRWSRKHHERFPEQDPRNLPGTGKGDLPYPLHEI
jgi:hypothetical protein